jgi:hypothetical protein
MSYQRHISRIHNVPELTPGFVGPGHLAAPVISPEDFALNDPFIVLMDDHLDIGDRPLRGPHPRRVRDRYAGPPRVNLRSR